MMSRTTFEGEDDEGGIKAGNPDVDDHADAGNRQ